MRSLDLFGAKKQDESDEEDSHATDKKVTYIEYLSGRSCDDRSDEDNANVVQEAKPNSPISF